MQMTARIPWQGSNAVTPTRIAGGLAARSGCRVLRTTCFIEGDRFRTHGPPKGLQAVVVGGGIGGLLAAHSLTRHFDRVVLLEKDAAGSARVEDETFKQTSRRRHGVPQISQPHQLIEGAVVALETLLPGFRSEVVAKGGLALDLGLDVHYYDFGGVFPRAASELKGLGVTRRLLEQCIRDRVLREGEGVLEVRETTKVAQFAWEKDCVQGVVLEGGAIITGHLVVDASGRQSQTASWLENKGFSKPRTICVDPHVASASRIVAMPSDWGKNQNEDWKLLICKTQPDGRRGATLLPAEGNTWQVTLAEINGRGAPKTDEEFLEFARSLPDQTAYHALLRSEAITPVAIYSAMKSERVCYDEINMPRGLVVVGDAAQRHNAVYGQGIAATARGVVLLDQKLHALGIANGNTTGGLDELTKVFQTALRQHSQEVWDMAVKSDMRYSDTTVLGMTAASNVFERFLGDTLLRAAKFDCYVYHQLLSVAHLAKPSKQLVKDPRVLAAIAGQAIKDVFQGIRR